MNKQRVDFPTGENVREDKRGTPRGRLVELLQGANKEAWCLINMSCCEEKLKLLEKIEELRADYLLENGVIVPPCKVGDVVYEVDLPEYGIIVCKVTKALYDSEEVIINVIDGHGKGSEYYFDFDDFGKTVFLTKEEAEAKLKEGVQG